MAGENLFMLYAFLMGIFITFVYDLLRIVRRVVAHNGFWVAVEDLIFWMFCGIAVFLLMYHMSNGTLRWFAVLGALAGMFLYHRTVSRFLVKYVSALGNKIKQLLCRMVRLLLTPVKAILRCAGGFTGSATRKAAGDFKRFRAFMKKRLTIMIKMLKMLM